MLEISPCFQCRAPQAKEWQDPKTLQYAIDTDRLCDLHKAAAEEKIKNAPKTYVLKKEMGAFLPPIPKKIVKSYYEREVGEEG